MEQLNYFDIAIVVLVLFFAVKGFMHGVVKEVLGLIGLVGGVYLASRYGLETGAYLSENVYAVEGKSITFIIGFMVFLIGFWLSSLVVSAMILALTNKNGIGFGRRFLGFLAGGLKIFLIMGIFVFLLSRVEIVQQNFSKQLEDSMTYPLLTQAGDFIVGVELSDIKEDAKEVSVVKALPIEEKKSIENTISKGIEKVIEDANVSTEVIAHE